MKKKLFGSYKLCPVWTITSGAIQYGVPFIDLAAFKVAYKSNNDINKKEYQKKEQST